jgi:hypothetical protein
MELNKNTLKLLFIIFIIFYVLSKMIYILKYILILLIIIYILAYYGTKDYNKELFECVDTYDLCDDTNNPIKLLGIGVCFNNLPNKIKQESKNSKIIIFKNYARLFFDNIRQLNLEKIKNIFNNIEFSTSYVPQLYKTINCN